MSRAWLIGVAIAVSALVIAALVIALVTSRDGGLLPHDTPEGAVQRYLLALEDEDIPEAYAYLSGATKSRCTLEEFAQEIAVYEVRDSQVTLEDVRRFDSAAIVVGRVTVFEQDSFPPSEYAYDVRYNLRLERRDWKITYPEYRCPPLFGRGADDVQP